MYYISISVLLHKMYLQHQVCSSLSIYDFTCSYYNTVSVASVFGSESWRLYEDLKKKFDGSCVNSNFHLLFVM